MNIQVNVKLTIADCWMRISSSTLTPVLHTLYDSKGHCYIIPNPTHKSSTRGKVGIYSLSKPNHIKGE